MHTLLLNWCVGRLGRAGIVLFGAVALLGIGATSSLAQPANDYITNAIQIAGPFGITTGSNVGATSERGEAVDADVGGGKTIWYAWTCTNSMSVEFDTEGSDFDTAIGVYALTGTDTNVSSLTLVGQNDDVAFPSDLTSKVIFAAASNTVYYISVDGNEGDSGDVILNWSGTGDSSGGLFGFAAPASSLSGIPLYIVSPWDSSPGLRGPANNNGPGIADYMPMFNMRARVVRTGGSAGAVVANYSITNTFYTNFLKTNIFGTNICTTNLSDLTYSNICYTNYYSFNQIQNFQNGGFTRITVSNSYLLVATNINDNIQDGFTNQLAASGYPFVPCANITLPAGFATNGTAIYSITTNIFCTNVTLTNIVPTAVPWQDYTPVASQTVELYDFQAGEDIPFSVMDSIYNRNIPITQKTSPFDLVNHLVLVNINSVTYDSLEDTNVLSPPVIGDGTAYVEIINPYAIPGTLLTTNIQANFVKSVNWINEIQAHAPVVGPGQRTAKIYVRRSGYDSQASLTLNYVADQVAPPNGALNHLDTFGLQPGSDYATPDVPGPTPSSKSPAHYTLQTGQISWGQNDFNDKEIDITINYDPAVQFNEDILVELYNPNTPHNAGVGSLNTSTLTILFNDQPAGALDRTHNQDNEPGTAPPLDANPGAGSLASTVYAVAVQPNDQTIIAGDFTSYNGQTGASRLARIKLDGSRDTTFMASPNSGANNTVTCLALQPNNSIIIGGVFTSFNGASRNHIARLNSDGSLDTTFNPGVGADSNVWATAVQPDGKVLVGGDFTSFNGTKMNHLARLTTNGVLDTNFNLGIGPNGTINAIAMQFVQNDWKIVIGGQFTTIDNASISYIARLNSDGTLDTNFNIGTGVDQPVYTLTQQPDGRLILGGAFTSINSVPNNKLARLNADGSIDPSFSVGTGPNDAVYTTAVDTQGNILLGGMFTSYNGTRRLGLARVLQNGDLDTGFMDTAYNQFAGLYNKYHNISANPVNFLYALGLQSDGNVIIGGHFQQLGGNGNDVYTYRRDVVSSRRNVARMIGGLTPGPGNIGLSQSSYSQEKDGGPYFVELVRTNGGLGSASASLSTSALHMGSGDAAPNQDYISLVQQVNWGTTWAFGTWAKSDAFFGPNDTPSDLIGGHWIPANSPYVFVLNNTNTTGNLDLNLVLSQPTGNLTLGNEPIATGVALSRQVAPMTIVDDTSPPCTLNFSLSHYYVDEKGGNAVITVTSSSLSQPVSVQFLTVPGTAKPGATNDYTAVSRTLQFDSTHTSYTINVPVVNNFVYTTNRYFYAVLTNASAGAVLGSNSPAMVTIINDNYAAGFLTFSDTDYTAHENSGVATITVLRLGGNQGTEKVSFATSDGSATAGQDYIPTNGVLTWQSSDPPAKTFNVQLLNSGLINSNLTVNLVLSNAITINGTNDPNALQSPTNATLTIINDNAFGSLSFSASTYNVNENAGAVLVTVNRLGGSSQNITVDYTTEDGTGIGTIPAIGGIDYNPTSGTLTFTNGQISQTFLVYINDQLLQSYTGATFTVKLSNPQPSSGPGGGVTLGGITIANVIINAEQIDIQPPGSPDNTFNIGSGFNNNVNALVLQPDGSILAGGDFTLAEGVARNRIARLNSSGSVDLKFSSGTGGANGSVRALAVQSDGQILVGGSFTTFNNVIQNYLARLNYSGALDSSFNIGGGPDAPVYAIAETFVGGTNASNRRIIIGGRFSSVSQNFSYRGIAQLNGDGSVDTTFNSSGVNGNGTVYAVAVYPATDSLDGGKILIAGDFTNVNNTPVNYIARLNPDGSLDTSFNNSQFVFGPNNSVLSLAIQLDGQIIIGGSFTSVDNISLRHIARLNRDGTVDPTYNVGPGADDSVTALALQQDWKVVAGGAFTQASGVTRNRLTRLNLDGTVDAGINFGFGANDSVNAVVIQPDGKLLIAGAFTQFNGQPESHIARLFGSSELGEGVVQFSSALYQVNESGTNAVITVQRVGGTGDNGPGGYSGPVSVLFNTGPHSEPDGLPSATDGLDYIGVTNLVLTFQPGETIQKVTIPILTNNLANKSELYVDLSLSAPGGDSSTNAIIGAQPTAELGIIGANSTVSFTSSDFSVPRDISTGSALITIQRLGSTSGDAWVQFFTTTNGSATPGFDFIPVTNAVYFPTNATSESVLIPVINNPATQGDVTVGFALANPTNTALDTTLATTATLTIVDTTPRPGKLGFSASAYVAPENGTNATITIVRTNGIGQQVSISFATSDGTAKAGTDYVATNNTLRFLEKETMKTFDVPLLNNPNQTNDVILTLTLSSPTDGAQIFGPSSVTLTILDENYDVSFDQGGYYVDETSGDQAIVVNRIGNTNGTIYVNYSTTDVTAKAGVNYTKTSGTLVFTNGQSSQSFRVPIIYDPQITGNLAFYVNLSTSNGSPVVVTTPSVPVTVLDHDTGFALASATNSVIKGNTNAIISVVRLGNTAGSPTVNFTASGGTASLSEYVPVAGTVTFTNGLATNYFTVPILNDNQIDGDQTVNVSISNPSVGVLLAPANGVLTIIDTESGFKFSSAGYSVEENGVAATITVLRTGVINTTNTVNYATSDGNARAGKQYVSTSGTLVFTNGQTSQTFQVPIIDNNVTGGSESFNVLLSSPSANSTLVSPSATTVTILNNDGSLIVPAGSAVIAPANTNVLYSGTNVTVLLALRNTAGSTATNVVATLLGGNGITPTGTKTQNYGNLITNGPSVFMPFSFTPTNANGSTVTAVLQLNFDNTNTGTASFTYQLGSSTKYFTNSTYITINDMAAGPGNTNPAPATPYPSSITINNLIGVASKVTATVTNLGHAYLSDVSMLLAGPMGTNVLLMYGNGGNHSITNVTITFDSSASTSLGINAPTISGISTNYAPDPFYTYNPLNTYNLFPSTNGVVPPAQPYSTDLGDYFGTNPNGTWSLYVDDTKPLDAGSINNGWILGITTLGVVQANNDLVVGLSASSSQVIVSSNLTFTIAVTNAGPSPATGVTVSNMLPAGVTLVSVSPSQGTYSTNAGVLTCKLGNLTTNGTAFVNVTVKPTITGSITNAVYVADNEFEDNLANNSASVVADVTSSSADLGIAASVTPNPAYFGNALTFTITVTNLGPGTATGVIVTNSLPAGFTLTGDTASGGYTTVSGLITSALGDLGGGTSRSFTMTVTSSMVGTFTITNGVSSGVFDPLKGNNVASLKSVISYVPLGFSQTGNSLTFTWPLSGSTTYRLQSATSLTPPVTWTTVNDAVSQVNGQNTVTVPVSAGSTKFFRLITP